MAGQGPRRRPELMPSVLAVLSVLIWMREDLRMQLVMVGGTVTDRAVESQVKPKQVWVPASRLYWSQKRAQAPKEAAYMMVVEGRSLGPYLRSTLHSMS